MKNLLQFSDSNGAEFYVEVEDSASEGITMRGGPGEESRSLVQNAGANFEKAISPLKSISNTIISGLKELVHSPDEVNIELGLKFSAKAGIIITSVDSEANLKIALKWKKNSGKGE